jgi:endonuclease/exonuclease/phosphatase family metal-dependent hydrolase
MLSFELKINLNYSLMQKLSVITINTWKCEGDYLVRIKYLADELLILNPDIILCQECFCCDSKGISTLGYLAEKLEMYQNYVPSRKKERFFLNECVISESGLGILSKFEIEKSEFTKLPNVPGDDERMLQKLTIELPNSQKLQIVNVHLTHINTLKNYRLSQVDFIIDQIENIKDIFIIGGDFNGLPDSEEINRLISKGNVIDLFSGFDPLVERSSLVEPYERGKKLNVDYLFTSKKNIENGDIEIINAQTVLDHKNPNNNQYASDHFGIMVKLQTHTK